MQALYRLELLKTCESLAGELKKLGESTKTSRGLRTYRAAINALGARKYSALPEAKAAKDRAALRLMDQACSEMKSDVVRHLRRLERKHRTRDVYQPVSSFIRFTDEKEVIQRLKQHRQVEVARAPSLAAEKLDKAIRRGDETKREWVQQGSVMPGSLLAAIWGISSRTLRAAVERGELVALKVGARFFYPESFLHLHREMVQALTSALGDLSNEEKFLFWMRPHGALGGKTLGEALKEPEQVDQVLRLAKRWAEEAGA